MVNGGGERGEGGHESFFRDFFMVTDGVPLWRVTPALVSVSTPTSGHSVRIAARHSLNSLVFVGVRLEFLGEIDVPLRLG